MNPRRVVLLIILGLGAASPAIGQAALSAESGQRSADNPAPDHPAAVAHKHSVKLTWHASVPASNLPGDAVVGYNVYRSRRSHDHKPKQINSELCRVTTYIDTDVKAGKTYFYVTRGVTANGVQSGPSNEAKAKIPKHD